MLGAPKANVKVDTFDVFDGARPSYAAFQPHAARSPDGRLWFANQNVMQMIDPNHLEMNALPPPVHIEQIVADRVNYSAGDHMKTVLTWTEVAIESLASCSWFLPIRIVILQSVTKAHFLWYDETQCGVVDFQIAC